ncbi:hemerythrin domain-containing protein [Aquihabitans sp. McL0605]|uniref:hemerythrin domain-containing protein n=1 Tax=Aquihabitans sp. McL0605 TaxID=3415671 RepID=UPI003CEFE40F
MIDHLIGEHRKVEGLLAQLKDSDEGSDRNAMFEELASSLDTHMRVEERYIYPMISDLIGQDEASDATDEHELARDGLASARTRLEEGAFEAAIEILEAGIAHHVEEEEQELFPQLRVKAADQLDGMDPERLEAHVEEHGAAIDLTKEELYDLAKQQGIEGRSKMTKDELAGAVGRS